MREILFRGKRKDNGEWVEGYYLQIGDVGKLHYILTGKLAIENGVVGFEQYEVIPETVGQYTGLEANGKKIFEGDIHEFICDEGGRHLFVVKFGKYYDFESDDERYGLYFQNIRTGDCNSFYGNEKDYANIIGNIHDNPELLEGGEE